MAKKQAAPRVIIIVGANRGIGYYMVKHLLELGNFISVLDIETDNLKNLKENYPDKLFAITADAAKDEDIKNGVYETIKQFGKIDIAVHNACLCTFESEPDSDYGLYNKVMDINFFGALRLSKAVLPQMRKQGFGRIIFRGIFFNVFGGHISYLNKFGTPPDKNIYLASRMPRRFYFTRLFTGRLSLVLPGFAEAGTVFLEGLASFFFFDIMGKT